MVIVIREFCLIQSSMLVCISAFVEDKNKQTFHFNSLLVFQQTIQSITVIHTMSMLNLFQRTININSETFIRKTNLWKPMLILDPVDKCMVRILDFYKSKVPSEPKAFYLHPLEKVPSDFEKL